MKLSIFTTEKKSLYIGWASFRYVDKLLTTAPAKACLV